MAAEAKSRDARERLIDQVKQFPVLYDTRHEHHRDIDARDSCWNQIAQRLDANSEVLKREWKILRDSLRQSLRKSRQPSKQGAPVKLWRFHQRMAFVLPYMTSRNAKRTFVSQKSLVKNEKAADSEAQSEQEEAEAWEPDAGADAFAGADAYAGAGDALELFFASVCAGARRLPRTLQARLKRDVLAALQRAEDDADAESKHAAYPAPL